MKAQSTLRPRIGLVSDCSLTLFELQLLLERGGYQVVQSCHPERLDPVLLARAHVDAWFVSLSPGGEGDHYIALLFDLDVPVLVDEAMPRSAYDAHSAYWPDRVLAKLGSTGLAPTGVSDGCELSANPLLAKARTSSRQRQAASNIWVLGASLGGPEALVAFLSRLPADLPYSFVYAQHIDDNCTATLTQVMSRSSALTVRMLGHGDVLTPGQLGIMPVGEALQCKPLGKVVASGDGWRAPFAPSINQVGCEVASIYRECAGLIVFSGMGDDGALACATMRRCGGRVWAQDPASCICPGMPEAAMATSCVDFVAEPCRLAEALLDNHNNTLNIRSQA